MVRLSTSVQVTLFAVVAAALGYAVVKVSNGWADWVVFGVIVSAALGGAIAVHNRQYPWRGKKRAFSRDSQSRW